VQVVARKIGSMFHVLPQFSDLIYGLANGEFLLTITRPRNLKFHKKFFALMQVGFNHFEPDFFEGAIKDFDSFRKSVIKMAGFTVITYNIDGTINVEAQSIKFSKMDDVKFSTLYNACAQVLLTYVCTNYTKSDLDAVVEELLRF
jgi:Protein of unknown function (DUF1367)